MPLPEVPIGTILAWVLKVDREDTGGDTVDLPDGWMRCIKIVIGFFSHQEHIRCDGSTIPHHNGSVWAGQRVPDLKGERRFLRGGADQDVLSLEEDQMEDHGHTVSDPGHVH